MAIPLSLPLAFSADGAVIIAARGRAPGYVKGTISSAKSAIHLALLFDHYAEMAQSLSKVIVHIIFSTKDREPWLDQPVRSRMHAYIATICRELNAEAFRVGGVSDHLHILTTFPRTISQSSLVETVKKTSSWR